MERRIPKATLQRRLQENNRNSGALRTFKQQLVYKMRVRYVKVTIANFGISPGTVSEVRCDRRFHGFVNRSVRRTTFVFCPHYLLFVDLFHAIFYGNYSDCWLFAQFWRLLVRTKNCVRNLELTKIIWNQRQLSFSSDAKMSLKSFQIFSSSCNSFEPTLIHTLSRKVGS